MISRVFEYLWTNRIKVVFISCLVALILMWIDYLIEGKYPTRFQWAVAIIDWLWTLFVLWVIEPKIIYKHKS